LAVEAVVCWPAAKLAAQKASHHDTVFAQHIQPYKALSSALLCAFIKLMCTVGLWSKHHAVLAYSIAAVWHVHRMQQFLNSSLPASMVPLLAVKLPSGHIPHHSLKLCFLIWITLTALTYCTVCPSFQSFAPLAHL